jgi:hypothetical protein
MGRKSGRKSSRRKTRLRTFGARYVDTFQLRDIRTVRERATRVWAAESILMTWSPYGAPSKNIVMKRESAMQGWAIVYAARSLLILLAMAFG